jgi:hypothetical protein
VLNKRTQDASTSYLSPHLDIRIFWTMSWRIHFDSYFPQKVFCERIAIINFECPTIEDNIYVDIEMIHSIKPIVIRRWEANPMAPDKNPCCVKQNTTVLHSFNKKEVTIHLSNNPKCFPITGSGQQACARRQH